MSFSSLRIFVRRNKKGSGLSSLIGKRNSCEWGYKVASWNKKIDRWSLSAMKQWTKCPAQYAYQRFEKLKTPPVPALEKGTKVHSLAEAFLRGEVTGMPKELKLFEKEFIAIRNHGFIPEANWAVTADWQPCGWDDWDRNWCLGKTDAHFYIDHEKHLEIIDFKTGRIYPDHEEGAEVYSCLGHSYYPEAETFTVEFWYLEQGAGNIGKSPYEYDLEDIHRFKKKWERKAHRMMRSKNFKPRPGRFACNFCNFRTDRQLADGTPGPCDAWKDIT